MSKPSLAVIIERLENLKEDLDEMKESIRVLQEDYVKRQSLNKVFMWGASIVSAGITIFVKNTIDKFK